jgi:hypothetical protein
MNDEENAGYEESEYEYEYDPVETEVNRSTTSNPGTVIYAPTFLTTISDLLRRS